MVATSLSRPTSVAMVFRVMGGGVATAMPPAPDEAAAGEGALAAAGAGEAGVVDMTSEREKEAGRGGQREAKKFVVFDT